MTQRYQMKWDEGKYVVIDTFAGNCVMQQFTYKTELDRSKAYTEAKIRMNELNQHATS